MWHGMQQGLIVLTFLDDLKAPGQGQAGQGNLEAFSVDGAVPYLNTLAPANIHALEGIGGCTSPVVRMNIIIIY
jgi:hypothetical protein